MTPSYVQQRYDQLKSRFPDALVLVQSADSLLSFDADATRLATMLRLELNDRSIPMTDFWYIGPTVSGGRYTCGVPLDAELPGPMIIELAAPGESWVMPV